MTSGHDVWPYGIMFLWVPYTKTAHLNATRLWDYLIKCINKGMVISLIPNCTHPDVFHC